MDVIEAVRTRRSVGKVDGEISRDEIRALIEAATWAPNHHLTEPWMFAVLTGAARERLGSLWAKISADEHGITGPERENYIEGTRQKVLRAPVLIVVSTRTDDDPIVAAEDFAATAAAVQNMLLAATATGLGAMWRTGGMVYNAQIKRHLGLDERDRIVAVVYLGRPVAGAPKPQPRKLDEVVRWLDAG